MTEADVLPVQEEEPMAGNPRRRFQSAKEWPPWTDAFRYILTDAGPYMPPGEADREWAATNNADSHDDGPVPDRLIDRAAEEAEAQDRYERGFGPC